MKLTFEEMKQYTPILLKDKKEPFEPDLMGIKMYVTGEKSDTFNRKFMLPKEASAVIEFAVFWTYDITHLYDLEHVWIYIAETGDVVDAEASFHGRIMKSLIPQVDNLKGKQVTLYCQPGKHALASTPIVFHMMPDYRYVTEDGVGEDGVLRPVFLESAYEKNATIDGWVKKYMDRYRFEPMGSFEQYDIQDYKKMTMDVLVKEIPRLVKKEIEKYRKLYMKTNY